MPATTATIGVMTEVTDLADPRVFPLSGAAAPAHARLHALAAAALAAPTRQEADGLNSTIRAELRRCSRQAARRSKRCSRARRRWT
jgi:hypothetical protein